MLSIRSDSATPSPATIGRWLLGLSSRPKARAAAAVVSGNLIGSGAAFAAAIVAARALNLDEFAAFGVGIAAHSLTVQFADFGLGLVAVRETAGAWELDGDPATQHKLRWLVAHRIRTSVAVAVLIAVVVLLLPSLAPYRTAALIGAGGGVFGSLALFLVWALQGRRSFAAAGTVQATIGALRLVSVAACAVAGGGVPAMMVGYAALAPAAGAILAGGRLFSGVQLGGADGGRIEIDRGLRMVLAGAGIASALLLNGDVLLLTLLADRHEVATYAAAWRFGAGALLINTAIASVLLPFIVTCDEPWAEAKRLIRLGIGVAAAWAILAVPLAGLGVLILGHTGTDAFTPLLILLVAFAIDGFSFATFQIYLRIQREGMLLTAVAAELATMVGVTLLFRHEGALAPAIGQLAARLVGSTIIATPFVLRALGRSDWFAPVEPTGAEPPLGADSKLALDEPLPIRPPS